MKKIKRQRMDDSTKGNVWRSYSDMMSGLLLLFVLIMAVCLMQAQKNYVEKLAEREKQLATQAQLEDSQATVSSQQDQLNEKESELAAKELSLSEQAEAYALLQSQLEDQQKKLNAQQDTLTAQQATLAEQESELTANQALIAQQQDDLAASQSQLDDANALMQQQQQRIDQIIGVKADLIDSLNKEFKANNIKVDIDTQTGAILLDSSVLFDLNESTLTTAGEEVLNQILPVYCKVLLNSENADYIAEIIIDGYTDTTGDYLTNMTLSQGRAYAVAEYLYNTKDSFLSSDESEKLVSLMTANGKSFSNPILDTAGTVDMDASRRVEIKFRLKDEEMLSELQKLIEESQEKQH